MTPPSYSGLSGRLVGVYNANGGLVGELSYVLGKIRGTTHCALCDISHGRRPVAKKEWSQAIAALPLPMTVVHLNEMDAATSQLVSVHNAPAVVHIAADGTGRIILDSDALEACHGDPEAFADAVTLAL